MLFDVVGGWSPVVCVAFIIEARPGLLAGAMAFDEKCVHGSCARDDELRKLLALLAIERVAIDEGAQARCVAAGQAFGFEGDEADCRVGEVPEA